MKQIIENLVILRALDGGGDLPLIRPNLQEHFVVHDVPDETHRLICIATPSEESMSERRGEVHVHGEAIGEADDGTNRVCERARVCTPFRYWVDAHSTIYCMISCNTMGSKVTEIHGPNHWISVEHITRN